MTNTDNLKTLLLEAAAHLQHGRRGEAEARLKKILAQNPHHADANHLFGIIAGQRGHFNQACRLIGRAISTRPKAAYWNDLAAALWQAGRLEEAVDAYDRVLDRHPNQAGLHRNRADILSSLSQFDEALESYEQAIRLNPGDAVTWNNKAITLNSMGLYEQALLAYQRALQLTPQYAGAHYNRGITLATLQRLDDALAAYEQAILYNPVFANAIYNRGILLESVNDPEAALSAYDRAIDINPYHAEAHNNRGNSLRKLGRIEEAIAAYDMAIQLKPEHAEAHNNRANILRGLDRFPEAIEGYCRAMTIDPDHLYAFSNYVDSKLRICEWTDLAEIQKQIENRINNGQSVDPFLALYCNTTAQQQLVCAKRFIDTLFPEPLPPLWQGEMYRHERIRLAYLSSDFHNHATAYLMIELLENHNRDKFEITAISFGPDDHSGYHYRLQQAFDRFLDVNGKDDAEVARLINTLEIDIAIDLKGNTQGSRPGILAHRPAPVQVNYLGYPATMGADFIDYIIVDPVTVPASEQVNFSEQLSHLPDCYQANDSGRVIAERTPMRAECGLPEEGFVFCSFNNNIKITPRFFDIWMRLLDTIPGSVLWLLEDNGFVKANLRMEALARGVSPDRLVFAPRMTIEEHLARQRLADLFLDTLPFNAHTTASDALWAGLPVLTCTGITFAGRVASSLLKAVGLPELVTETSEDYEALAKRLATTPAYLKELRTRLEKNRQSTPLLDSDRFRKNIEAAYLQMWKNWQHARPREQH